MKKVFILGYQEVAGIFHLVGMREGKLVSLPTLNDAKDLRALPELTEERLDEMAKLAEELTSAAPPTPPIT